MVGNSHLARVFVRHSSTVVASRRIGCPRRATPLLSKEVGFVGFSNTHIGNELARISMGIYVIFNVRNQLRGWRGGVRKGVVRNGWEHFRVCAPRKPKQHLESPNGYLTTPALMKNDEGLLLPTGNRTACTCPTTSNNCSAPCIRFTRTNVQETVLARNTAVTHLSSSTHSSARIRSSLGRLWRHMIRLNVLTDSDAIGASKTARRKSSFTCKSQREHTSICIETGISSLAISKCTRPFQNTRIPVGKRDTMSP